MTDPPIKCITFPKSGTVRPTKSMKAIMDDRKATLFHPNAMKNSNKHFKHEVLLLRLINIQGVPECQAQTLRGGCKHREVP
ncbi:hypothetical protein TNCV_4232601 [Trichonephila clavipes]|nr:hypothetical protein TNCV_4232601 [Trichonephila clavipes]